LGGRAVAGIRQQAYSWRNSREWQVRALTLHSGPVDVQVSLNKTCNLRCRFCIRQADYYKELMRNTALRDKVLPFPLMENNMALLTQAKTINVATDGEPVLHPSFNELLALLSA